MNAPRVLHIPDRIVLDILMVLEVGLVVVSAALAKVLCMPSSFVGF